MRSVIPPILFALLLVPLGLLAAFHLEGGRIWTTTAAPWDVPLPLGLALLVWARLHFKRRSAEIHTFREPRSLVTDGPFRFSRNPMYLGFALLLLAAALAVNTWCALLAPLTFLLVAAFWYVPHEERNLRAIFGTAYDDYAWRTRRWI
ncbi:MAG: isoprenylcysteine carboxylmethyltransferase family protein [Pseudomonadota bacterium]